jgi:hypothetical protein
MFAFNSARRPATSTSALERDRCLPRDDLLVVVGVNPCQSALVGDYEGVALGTSNSSPCSTTSAP